MRPPFVGKSTAEHRKFTGGRTLTHFFDTSDIPNFASWETEIFQKHLVKSRLFLAFLSFTPSTRDVIMFRESLRMSLRTRRRSP